MEPPVDISELDTLPYLLIKNYKTEKDFLKDYPEIDFEIINWR